ncbi:hypothetical protein LBMAG57_36450 [Verrucomicrobiota bacterium]|nr:hypothetical protein LBMAG57_36450 [Verrucomicrobiota bacterium]GDY22434.1 hypothetical protein LBMAG56_37810 [Verrucomicrobiota bacterium]
MNEDTIVQEVRDIRASIAAEFGYDRTKLIAWAREQTRQRKALGNARPDKALETTGGASKSSVARKRRVRPARVLA